MAKKTLYGPSATNVRATNLIGKQIGKYQIQELLGKGGMGRIYKAAQPTLERAVAIKLIQLDQATDSKMAERFRREAKVVAALRHPGVIQVYDFDIEDDLLYMVMEYVPGESLGQRLAGIHAQGRKLPLEEAVRLFHMITQATAYAHKQGVIHCDLKPGNVLLTTEGQPVLTDFGIAKFISGERLTATGDIIGTPHYMAPEQATGGEIGPHTDVYALGVMLYELTTGVLPFSGDTSMSIVFKHVTEPPPPPQSINPALPEVIAQIIQRAMAKPAAERYPSAQELLADIETFIRSNGPVTVPPACIYICYKHHAQPDEELALFLHDALTAQGHQSCVDPLLRAGAASLVEVDREIKGSDFFIVLLSAAAADSEMVTSEISQAYQYHRLQGKPDLLPVRVAYDGPWPYALRNFWQPLHYLEWHSQADNEGLVAEILRAIAGKLPQPVIAAADSSAYVTDVISEDGQLIPRHQIALPPLPAFDPHFLKELAVPGGAVKLRDRLYIERAVDEQLLLQLLKWGSTITIRAPRQTGKTSLLVRGLHAARSQGHHVVFLDFQSFGREALASLDQFLQELAQSICDELDLPEAVVDEAWEGSRSPTKKLTRFMEKDVLEAFDRPIVLAMDEADGLLQTNFYQDFFGLLRSWHNRRASRELWEKLNLVLVISTEPYLLIDDIHQSPFNVGLYLGLQDFEEAQVRDLNYRHGSVVAEENLAELLALLNGHPFLTRLAMYKMVAEGLSWAELRQAAPTDYGPFGDHLRHQYWIIHDKPELKNGLRDIILTKCCPDESSLFRLLQAGLIKGSGDAYSCRCDLYRLYFEDKLL